MEPRIGEDLSPFLTGWIIRKRLYNIESKNSICTFLNDFKLGSLLISNIIFDFSEVNFNKPDFPFISSRTFKHWGMDIFFASYSISPFFFSQAIKMPISLW